MPDLNSVSEYSKYKDLFQFELFGKVTLCIVIAVLIRGVLMIIRDASIPAIESSPLDFTLLAYPLLVEGLLFLLICVIITILSLSLDEEGSDGALSFLS